MKRRLSLCLLMPAIAASAVGPTVSDVSIKQEAAAKRIEVGYTLSGAPAVVTVAFSTNTASDASGEWIPLCASTMSKVVGDAFRVVETGNRKIYWLPDGDFAHIDAGAVKAEIKAWPTNNPPDYLVCDIVSGANWYYENVEQLPGGIGSDDYRKHLFVMRKIPARNKTWWMCAQPTSAGYDSTRECRHQVMLTNDYYMGVFEVTQWQWKNVMGADDYSFTFPVDGDMRPFEGCIPANTVWSGGQAWPTNSAGETVFAVGNNYFIGQLRTRTGLGERLFLPTEAQWEFACRAGQDHDFNDGGDVLSQEELTNPHLDLLGRYAGNGGVIGGGAEFLSGPSNGTARVGSYLPNAFGLYDMHGNVSEWCIDLYNIWGSRIPLGWDSGEIQVDPLGDSVDDIGHGTWRCARGGNWSSPPSACRASDRSVAFQFWLSDCVKYCGFRMCLTLSGGEEQSSVASATATGIATAYGSFRSDDGMGDFDTRFESVGTGEATSFRSEKFGSVFTIR